MGGFSESKEVQMNNKVEGDKGRWVQWNTDSKDKTLITQWEYNRLAEDCYDWALQVLMDKGLRFYKSNRRRGF